MARELERQLVVRVTPELAEALRIDAEENGRTVAQSARYHLRRALAELAAPLRAVAYPPVQLVRGPTCRSPLCVTADECRVNGCYLRASLSPEETK